MFFYIKCVLFVLVLSISGEISAQEKRDSVRIIVVPLKSKRVL